MNDHEHLESNQTNGINLKSNPILFRLNSERNSNELIERTKKPHSHRPKIDQSQQIIEFDKSADALKKLKDDQIPKQPLKSM